MSLTHPKVRERLQADDDGYAGHFVQEVRRFYPFFPAVAERTRQAFEWNGYRFPQSRRVILDLYGTNQDPRTWEKPEEFNPERFRQWGGSPFDFIPQGGGDHYLDHRCPGEWIAIDLMKLACGFPHATHELRTAGTRPEDRLVATARAAAKSVRDQEFREN